MTTAAQLRTAALGTDRLVELWLPIGDLDGRHLDHWVRILRETLG